MVTFSFNSQSQLIVEKAVGLSDTCNSNVNWVKLEGIYIYKRCQSSHLLMWKTERKEPLRTRGPQIENKWVKCTAHFVSHGLSKWQTKLQTKSTPPASGEHCVQRRNLATGVNRDGLQFSTKHWLLTSQTEITHKLVGGRT